ncbi:hypothetical protein BDZ45DRAFT_243823 [Acephala macrosclerotiorum]|nr:hypothetical protein BDZ45DRAFT_243823 [Acephala macrosclerotiorum]
MTGAICNEPYLLTVSGSREHHSLLQPPETPVTKAKRKREPREAKHHDNQGGYCNQNLDGNRGSIQSTTVTDDPFTQSRQPSEYATKAAKTSTLSTPGQRFTERLKSQTISLPTPTHEIISLRAI